jgi:methionyl-tRNA synthetase
MQQFFINNMWVVLVLLVWSMIWKGLALWKAAHREQKVWFVVFLIVNTCGILEIIYLFVITRVNKDPIKENS